MTDRRLGLGAALALLTLLLAACGGGGGSSAPAPAPRQVPVGGTISGLPTGQSITLRLNGSLQTFVGNAGEPQNFGFTTRVGVGSAYNVTVALLPLNQLCSVTNATGQVSGQVSNVRIACVDTLVNDVGVAAGIEGAAGRDAAATLGNLDRLGGGRLGFDFTRVCNSGEAEGTGGCPALPAAGAGANQWGCTADAVTGLLWQSFTGTTATDHAGAVAAVAAANGGALCGRTDWRLPSVIDLTSLVNSGAAATAVPIDTDYFPDTDFVSYWSGEGRSGDPAAYWVAAFGANGAVGTLNQADSARTRVVAGTPPAGGLTLTSATVFSDSRHALMWLTTGETGTQAEAIASAAVQNSAVTGGFDDWRLPNRNELGTLVDRSQRQPSIDPALGVGRIEPAGYWSTTPLSTAAGVTQNFAWVVDFDNGDILPRPVSDVRRILLVRGIKVP